MGNRKAAADVVSPQKEIITDFSSVFTLMVQEYLCEVANEEI
jgi:hypothetical protein